MPHGRAHPPRGEPEPGRVLRGLRGAAARGAIRGLRAGLRGRLARLRHRPRGLGQRAGGRAGIGPAHRLWSAHHEDRVPGQARHHRAPAARVGAGPGAPQPVVAGLQSSRGRSRPRPHRGGRGAAPRRPRPRLRLPSRGAGPPSRRHRLPQGELHLLLPHRHLDPAQPPAHADPLLPAPLSARRICSAPRGMESLAAAPGRKSMSLKSDRWIRRMAREHRMIEPFSDTQVREGVISYGLSSYGYDVRIADEFKIFTNINSTIVDPKNFDPRSFVDFEGPVCIIPPNSFALARTVEYFRIPRNVLTICVGKSTYARCGIIVNVTPFEPEWEGIVTLEVSNTTPLPAKIYAGEGVAQVLFFEGDEPCEVSYADKKGKYQAQKTLTLPKL